ncbi:MAG TPA: hypothetical protein VJI12_00645 [archaeon]|nr:hypothetical protein [archaeon]
MAADIGAILFVNLLGMTGYPGSPFTGNIYRDLIMFLIVPTIFIIFVLYIATGRIIPDKKMRIMLGVGAYLFIIVSGYYSVFALLSGPYFIFLIFILGLLGFIVGHFRRGGHGGGFSGSHSYGGGFAEGGKIGAFEFTSRAQANRRMKELHGEIEEDAKEMRRIEGQPESREKVARMEERIYNKKEEIRQIKERLRTLPG